MSDEQKQVYEKQLNISGTGVMGYIDIPSIKVSLPIYHGIEKVYCRLRSVIWIGQAFRSAEREAIVYCPVTAGCRVPLPQKEKDLCTLVTCTPYGVNSHRLLVRGYRIEHTEDVSALVTADAMRIDPMIVAPTLLLVYLKGR